jgi:Glycosyl hydrolase family 20, catalytic domain
MSAIQTGHFVRISPISDLSQSDIYSITSILKQSSTITIDLLNIKNSSDIKTLLISSIGYVIEGDPHNNQLVFESDLAKLQGDFPIHIDIVDQPMKSTGEVGPPVRIDIVPQSVKMKIRGLHLDPARRMLTSGKVIEIVKNMSIYGLNTLHLHLTDDQGIGLDIKTLSFYESNGWSIDDQEAIADVCEKEGIDIIPEIDIPGHTAALRGLLERGEYTPSKEMGIITEGLLREEDLPKILEIFDELCTRFRVKKYIHMGGDETRGAKRPYFKKLTDDVCEWARKKNLTVIAWEDILNKIEDIPDNMIIQKWKQRTYPPIAKGLEKIGPSRIIYSNNYYLDTSPDPFTMFRKNISKIELGCIMCTWGELIGMENIDGILYPSMILLGELWNGTHMFPIEVLKKYRNVMIYPEISNTWKRRQWTGFMKGTNVFQPRSSHLDVDQPLNREHDHYPICSRLLIDMTIDIHDRIRSLTDRLVNETLYKNIFLEAKADEKILDGLFLELRAKNPKLSLVKTALRRVQRSQEEEEQVFHKNGLRMVVRELLRIP